MNKFDIIGIAALILFAILLVIAIFAPYKKEILFKDQNLYCTKEFGWGLGQSAFIESRCYKLEEVK